MTVPGGLIVIFMAMSVLLTNPITGLANSIEHMGIDSGTGSAGYTSAPYLNMGRQQMLNKTWEIEKKGYRPADVVSYNHSSSIRYSVVMSRDEDRAYDWVIKPNVPAAQVERLVESQFEEGFRPAAISVAEDSRGQQRATLHFVQDGRFEEVKVRTADSPRTFQREFNRLVRQGYRPIRLRTETAPLMCSSNPWTSSPN